MIPRSKRVIITGAGNRAFCCRGRYSRELAGLNTFTERRFPERGQQIFSLIEHSGQGHGCYVNGYALGGGCELAMACHFGLPVIPGFLVCPEVTLGLIPGYGGTQRLTSWSGKAERCSDN